MKLPDVLPHTDAISAPSSSLSLQPQPPQIPDVRTVTVIDAACYSGYDWLEGDVTALTWSEEP